MPWLSWQPLENISSSSQATAFFHGHAFVFPTYSNKRELLWLFLLLFFKEHYSQKVDPAPLHSSTPAICLEACTSLLIHCPEWLHISRTVIDVLLSCCCVDFALPVEMMCQQKASYSKLVKLCCSTLLCFFPSRYYHHIYIYWSAQYLIMYGKWERILLLNHAFFECSL